LIAISTFLPETRYYDCYVFKYLNIEIIYIISKKSNSIKSKTMVNAIILIYNKIVNPK